MAPPVRFQRPELPATEDVEAYFAEALEARWFSNRGPCHRLLAERCSQALGVNAIPVASGTTGLLLAIRAAIEPGARGSEVLAPSFTFAPTATAIVWAGFEPVFVDVSPDAWHLDPDRLAEALARRGPRVAAVLACCTFGTPPPPAQREAWRSACAEAKVPLIIDSAAGFGACDELGRPLGGHGEIEVFSFHATKPLAIGEGGLVACADGGVARTVAALANFGYDDRRELIGCGINGKLDEWHCATALAALDRLPRVLEARRSRSRTILRELDGLDLVLQAGSERSTVQFVPVLAADSERRDAVLAAAEELDVEIRTYFDPPLHALEPFGAFALADGLEVTDDLARRCLSLPMANDLTDAEIDRIVGAVRLGYER
jgi:dTDP-4-amino-4,6-dideoxygalactose transaminase